MAYLPDPHGVTGAEGYLCFGQSYGEVMAAFRRERKETFISFQ